MPLFEREPRPRFGNTFLRLEIPSELSFKDPAIIRILRTLKEQGYLNREETERVRLSLDEAVKNAMMHGNHYNPSKKIKFRMFGDDKKWGILIEDEGEGMRSERVPQPLLGEQDLRESGYGILLMESVQDEVVFLGRGNQLLMTRHRSPQTEGETQESLVEVDVPGDDAMARAEYVTPASKSSGVPDSLEFKEEEVSRPAVPPSLVDAPGPRFPSIPISGATVESETKQLRVLRKDQVRVLELQDKHISDFNLSQIQEQLKAAAECEGILILDLHNVQYVSSVVLGAFVSLYKEFRECGAKIAFCSLNANLREVFKATRLDMLLPIFQDAASAARKLSG